MSAEAVNGTTELSGAKVAVIGLGASGRAAARLALTKGGQVYVSDLRADAQTAAGGAELRTLGADVEWGGHDIERLAGGGSGGGRFAPAASELALRSDAPDWYVLEMSSFQLGSIERFCPDIGVVT